MGSPTLWWYPRGATGVQSITLPRTTDLLDRPGREMRQVAPISGVTQTSDLGATREIEIVVEKLDSVLHASTIRSLQGLDSHLRSGGAVGYCTDADKALAYAVVGVAQGASTASLHHTTNLFAAYNSSASLSAGDYLTINDGNPDYRRAHTTYTSISGQRVTVGQAVPYSFGTCIMRYRDFYPVLRMSEQTAQRGQWLTSDHRLNWTMALRLQEHAGELMALVSTGTELADDTLTTNKGGLSLDTLLGSRKVAVTGIDRIFSPPQPDVGRVADVSNDPWQWR